MSRLEMPAKLQEYGAIWPATSIMSQTKSPELDCRNKEKKHPATGITETGGI